MDSSEFCAVVFDAVGTLIHPEPAAGLVYAEVGARFCSKLAPQAITERFRFAFQREEAVDKHAGWQTSEERERERWRAIVRTVLDDVADPETCFQQLFDHFSNPAAWRCDPDATDILQQLAERAYTLGLASNYDRRLRRVVAGLPLLRPIHYIAISSEIGWRKPAAEFFASLYLMTGLAPQKILFVGDDMANDYEGARAAGCQAVIFDPNNKAPSSVFKITRLRDLLAICSPLQAL
jgi:putative hydrolase of the HAD superfamily